MNTTNQRAVEEVAKVLALVQNGHPDYTPQPTADAFWGLLDDDQRERYRRMATAANKRTPGWRPISEAQVEVAARAIHACAPSGIYTRTWDELPAITKLSLRNMARAALSTLTPAPGEG